MLKDGKKPLLETTNSNTLDTVSYEAYNEEVLHIETELRNSAADAADIQNEIIMYNAVEQAILRSKSGLDYEAYATQSVKDALFKTLGELNLKFNLSPHSTEPL